MKPTRFFPLWQCTFYAWLLLSRPLWAEVTEETVRDPFFGPVAVYRPTDQPKGLLLLLSGSGSSSEITRLAKAAAKLDYLVAGLDSLSYLRTADAMRAPCLDLAEALQSLAHRLDTRYGLSPDKPPILMGSGTGATLVYAALAQAPVSAFHAGISLNFCPRLPVQKPLCAGRAMRVISDKQGLELLPSKHLQSGWFVFQSNPDCAADAAAFVDAVDNAKWVSIPIRNKEQNQPDSQVLALLQWLDPGIPNQVTSNSEIGDLPLTEIPVPTGQDQRMAVMLSGDGGWAALDRGVAGELVKHGIATVGWDSLSYFWNVKTPEQAAQDLERVLRHYLQAWHKSRVLLIGYSFGADVLPFMASRLPPDLQKTVVLIAFLGLGKAASFEFHLSDWLGGTGSENTLPTRSEVEKLGWAKRLCIFGAEESDSGCPALAQDGVTLLRLPGGHHFDEDYKGIVRRILAQIPP